MIRYFKGRDSSIRRIKSFESGCWISVVDPSDKELRFLSKEYGLDHDNLVSGLDENEIPRIDVDSQLYAFVEATTPDSDITQTFLVVLGKNFVLTLSKHETGVIRKLTEGKLSARTDKLPSFLITLLSNLTVDIEAEALRVVKSVERQRLQKLREKDLERLLAQETDLSEYVSTFYYLSLVYERIIKRLKFTASERDDMEEVLIDTRQSFDLCKSSLKTVSNLRRYYSVILTNRLNKTIKILTIFTIFITIPAAVSGLYGMNVALPWQNNPNAFYLVLTLILTVWITFVIYLKKREIL